MNRKIVTCLILAVLLVPFSLWGEEEKKESDFYFQLAKVRWYLFWGLDFLPTGADVTVGYKGLSLIPGRETMLQLTAGGGYDSLNLYRDSDGTPSLPGSMDPKWEFNGILLEWEPGIRQGIIWSDYFQRNLLETFLFYRGHYDIYMNGRVIWGTDEAEAALIRAEHLAYKDDLIFTDKEGVFSNSLFTGFTFDAMDENKDHKTKHGFYSEISLEWDPAIEKLPPKQDVDFLRLNFLARSFFTLYDAAPDREKNLFSLYLGENFSVDYATGTNIPMFVSQTFGGTKIREGLGYYVRGFEKWSYDTQLKIVNNIELRANLPAIYFKNLVPGLVAYFDAGYYRGYFGDPGELKQGFLCATGVGFYLDLFGVEYFRLYLQFPLYGERIDAKAMKIDVNFALHF